MEENREETIRLVDKHVVEERDNEELWAVSVNTSGETPDREALKSEIYYQGNVDIDAMAPEVPSEIGTVLYDDEGNIVSIHLEDWVVSEYAAN